MSHVDVGISEHEVGWEELDGVLTEDLVADHISHLIVNKTVGLLVTCLNNQTLSCLNCLIYLGFLYIQISFFSISLNECHFSSETSAMLRLVNLHLAPCGGACERHRPQRMRPSHRFHFDS